jgi:hypothetical protein
MVQAAELVDVEIRAETTQDIVHVVGRAWQGRTRWGLQQSSEILRA